MKTAKGRNGKRLARPSQRRGGKRAAPRGKREAPVQRSGWLGQLVVSGAILVAVVGVKLVSPATLEEFRRPLLELMGTETDFTAVFSQVGRAVGGEGGIAQVIGDAYVAVFGGDEIVQAGSDTAVYNSENTPEEAILTQVQLGFAYQAPVSGAVNDGFGYREHPIDGGSQFHYGLDMEAQEGAVITSFGEGRVSAVGESASLGKYVTVVHPGDYTTLYAHCSRVTASAGQQVKAGDPIAEAGKTGETTGAHLHFELYRDTTYYNPIYYVGD